MGYRLIADENIERQTCAYLRQLGHDVVWIGEAEELGIGASDRDIAAFSVATDRLVLTQDDDFFTVLESSDSAGIRFQADQRLSSRVVGEIIDAMSNHVPQAAVDLEFVSRNWL